MNQRRIHAAAKRVSDVRPGMRWMASSLPGSPGAAEGYLTQTSGPEDEDEELEDQAHTPHRAPQAPSEYLPPEGATGVHPIFRINGHTQDTLQSHDTLH